MVARAGAAFTKLVYQSYLSDFRPQEWDYNSAVVPYKLYLKRPDLLHVEWYKFTTPDWKDRDNLWKRVINWTDLYVIHVMGHLDRDTSSPQSIKKINSTFGEVMRYIYYGSPKLITS